MSTARCSLIREHGCKAGLVFNPATPLDWAAHVMDKLDMVLLMSVNPGFGGQQFIEATLPKLREARHRIDAHVAAAASRSGWKSTAASRPTTSPASRAPAPTPSWPAAPCSARPIADGGYRTVIARLREQACAPLD